MSLIENIRGRQIFDSRGNPTVEVDVTGGPDPVIVDHYTSLARIADA